MRTLKGIVRTDNQGSDCEFEFEVEDDATEQEIREELREWALEHVDWWYEEIE